MYEEGSPYCLKYCPHDAERKSESEKNMISEERKEAIRCLSVYSSTNGSGLCTDKQHYEAKQMAIKVLEQTTWIPVSERLPKELEPVNITWVNHEPEPYYHDIKDKPFTATGVYFNGQWYWWSAFCTDILADFSHNYDDIIDDNIEITAWTPLPEPYKEGEIK